MRSLGVRSFAWALSLLLLAASAARAQSCEPEDISERKALEAAIKKCDSIAATTTNSTERYAALCRCASYSFRIAQVAEGDDASDWAEHGMKDSSRAKKENPQRVEGHYRYALCLGVYLREHWTSVVSRLDELIGSARKAAELDEKYDAAGPHVLLASVYAEAPRLIGGDPARARKHMARFLALFPNDEGNKLAAVKIHVELGEEDQARKILNTIDPKRCRDEAARKELEPELEKLKKKLAD
ncbi:MAG: TRAP transporter TatT component family protein [Planctomycetota bacterium]